MKCDREHMLLYAVTDRAWAKENSLVAQVEAALRGGATCVQLREKRLGEAEFRKEAFDVRALCREYGVPFFVNDRVEIAIACGADGVHVGQDDMPVSEVRALVGPGMMIGASAHNVEEAVRAFRDGADCLGAGAMFATSTKSDVRPLPRQTLRGICASVPIPVVAIGGITADNMQTLAGTGVAGFALVSAIFAAEDIEGECRRLLGIARRTVNA